MLLDKRLGRLLLAREEHQRLLLPVILRKLRPRNSSMRCEVLGDRLLGDVGREAGAVDHLGGRAAVPEVLGGVPREAVQVGVAEVVRVLGGVDVGVLRVVDVHLLPEQHHALHSGTKYFQQQSEKRLPNCELTHCSRHTLGHRTLKALLFRAPGDILNTVNLVGKGGQHYQEILWLPLLSFPEKGPAQSACSSRNRVSRDLG